ncbi:MAG: phage holin family protein [Bacteroidota bacterium]
MKKTILFLLLLSLIMSCSVNFEKKLYRNGYFIECSHIKVKKEDRTLTLDRSDSLISSIPIKSPSLDETYPITAYLNKTRMFLTSKAIASNSNKKFESYKTISEDTVKVLIVNPIVGESIDSTEKVNYHLFPFWGPSVFRSARFIKKTDGKIYLEGTMKTGETKTIIYTESDFSSIGSQISRITVLSPEEEKESEDRENRKIKAGFLTFLYIIFGIILFFALLALIFFSFFVFGLWGILIAAAGIVLFVFIIKAMSKSIDKVKYG